MEDDAETLRKLAKLAEQVPPEDRACLERTIQLASLARRAVIQARERVRHAELRLEAAQDTTAHRQSQSRYLIAEVHFPGDRNSK
jgi:hypothetical protein